MSDLVLYPAIDLLGGRCLSVREEEAGPDSSFVGAFDGDPVAAAKRWREAGAEWLHVVDLDGAREGRPVQTEVVRAIAEATGLPIQLGGGIASEADAAGTLEAGAARVVLDTAVARDGELLAACLARWGERIAVSLDARGDGVTVAGWLESAAETALDLARRLSAAGVRTLLATAIERDGSLRGGVNPRLPRLRAALPDVTLIAAGRFSTLDDVRQLASMGMGGMVLGRALYDGTLDLAKALRVARATEVEVGETAPTITSDDAPLEADLAPTTDGDTNS